MCLGVPGKIIEIDLQTQTALVESLGVRRRVGLGLVPEAGLGDYVMVHAGFAIQVIDREDAAESLQLWEELLSQEAGEA